MTTNVKRLYRSRSDRMFAGVCGGVAEYFDIDATLVRLGFVVGALASVSGIFWAYLIMALIVPLEPTVVDVVPSENLQEMK